MRNNRRRSEEDGLAGSLVLLILEFGVFAERGGEKFERSERDTFSRVEGDLESCLRKIRE